MLVGLLVYFPNSEHCLLTNRIILKQIVHIVHAMLSFVNIENRSHTLSLTISPLQKVTRSGAWLPCTLGRLGCLVTVEGRLRSQSVSKEEGKEQERAVR
jgi:hypothetical protein